MKKHRLCANCSRKYVIRISQRTTPITPSLSWDCWFCKVTNERIWDKYCYCEEWEE